MKVKSDEYKVKEQKLLLMILKMTLYILNKYNMAIA